MGKREGVKGFTDSNLNKVHHHAHSRIQRIHCLHPGHIKSVKVHFICFGLLQLYA